MSLEEEVEPVVFALGALRAFEAGGGRDKESGDEQKCQNISFGCQDTCCNTIKVLTKTEEHEELLLELISKIEDPGLKTQYLKKLKKLLTHPETEASTSKT